MPCWYYDKQQLRDTPSFRDAIDNETERRYRREGARFIMDTGTKMGLRYDTCATGVVYFNRFYMFHSLREFNRYVTGACCLFLAGKVEETPKKCKDIIKISKAMLTDAQWKAFGEDPKEEVMTMERILLQTIKFDLMLEHPYAFLLKYAKLIKGDKTKVQKMVQMAWTFVNDSLCTTLCLQWEPEIIGVALMYLAGRLSKFEITDWIGKEVGFKGKWYDFIIDDVNLELLEDICHQVLDLYSAAPKSAEDSPPPPPPKPPGQPGLPQAQGQNRKRSRSPVAERGRPKVAKGDPHSRPSSPPSAKKDPAKTGRQGKALHNPYMSTTMYSSSFMSQEGSQNIQRILGGGAGGAAGGPQPAGGAQYPTYSQGSYPPGTYPQGYPYPQGTYPPNTQYPGYSQPSSASQAQYPATYPPTYSGQYPASTPPSSQYQSYPTTTPTTSYPSQASSQPYQPPSGPQTAYQNPSQYPQGQSYPAPGQASQQAGPYPAPANPPTSQAYPASQSHPAQGQPHPSQPQSYHPPARSNTPTHGSARANTSSHPPSRSTTPSHKRPPKGSNLTTVKISGR